MHQKKLITAKATTSLMAIALMAGVAAACKLRYDKESGEVYFRMFVPIPSCDCLKGSAKTTLKHALGAASSSRSAM